VEGVGTCVLSLGQVEVTGGTARYPRMTSRTGVGLQRSRQTPFGWLPNLRKPMAVAFFFFWLWFENDTISTVGRGGMKNAEFIGWARFDGGPASPETLRK